MLFNSYEFIFLFLPITLFIYMNLWRISKFEKSCQIIFLAFASLVFYAYWDVKYLPLLIISILFNYYMSLAINRSKSKKQLFFALTVNFLLLGFFKYTGFIIDTLKLFFDLSFATPNIILPLGISFFTFTQTAFLVDCYRDRDHKDCNMSNYSLFVTIFPHLIAGPILYHKNIIPQFLDKTKSIFSFKNFSFGLVIFIAGLFKKVMIADNLALNVNLGFSNPAALSFFEAWLAALGYTMQLYFDFSGYSEMAIGLALMFNFDFPVNFMAPYKATSIIDFWRRWHITLSDFLKNYLYIPLGGSHAGKFAHIRNLFITMLLGGLWHGAGWTFIIWGALHGVLLIGNHLWRKLNISMPRVISWFLTFLCVMLAWVFFRANTVNDAFSIIQKMFAWQDIILPTTIRSLIPFVKEYGLTQVKAFEVFKEVKVFSFYLGISLVLCFLLPDALPFIKDKFKPNMGWLIIIVLAFVICILNLHNVTEFLYFQF